MQAFVLLELVKLLPLKEVYIYNYVCMCVYAKYTVYALLSSFLRL